MCFYTSGMVHDQRLQINEIDKLISMDSQTGLAQKEIFSIIKQSIQFHCEMLE